ncbi:DUF1501 domain-containing protein [bacterium]|nr:DUF1501 domain-containing protein [bacterium]
MNRRNFLQMALLGGTLLALPGAVAPSNLPRRSTLIVLHLNGGNDGLNTVVPYQHPLYGRLRPGLALSPREVLPLERGLGLHRSLSGLHKLFSEGQMAIALGVGYPDPSFSHFRSAEIWNSGATDQASTGWLGRYLDLSRTCEGVPAASLQPTPPMCLYGAKGPGLSFTDPDRFRLPESLQGIDKLYAEESKRSGARGLVGRQGGVALAVARRLSKIRPAQQPQGPGLARDLRTALALLEADLGLQVLHLSMDGFDTHVNQRAQHARLLEQLSQSLSVFQQELARRGLAEQVLTMVYSEFGRRPAENSGGGTDHGTAGPVFLIGPGVRPGFHGQQSDLEKLENDNLRHTLDFRSIYAGLLEGWLGAEPQRVLANTRPLVCVRSQARP